MKREYRKFFAGDLGQPDDGFGCLNLAVEKRPLTALVAPMKKEARSFICYACWCARR